MTNVTDEVSSHKPDSSKCKTMCCRHKTAYRGSRSFSRCAITSCDGEADRATSILLSLLNALAAIIHNYIHNSYLFIIILLNAETVCKL